MGMKKVVCTAVRKQKSPGGRNMVRKTIQESLVHRIVHNSSGNGQVKVLSAL
jgi:hypothetical protein